jgi:predicted enzyme related to lactoylglutathione lyase
MTEIVVTLDCADPETLARFWAPALGYEVLGSAGAYVALVPSGGGPGFLLQRVEEPKSGKNRMHVDLKVPDVEREVERLLGLGAKRLSDATMEEHGSQWVVMTDPEGNEFCVCRA